MKNISFRSYLINIIVLATCISGGFYNNEMAENVFVFYSICFCSVCYFVVFVVDSKDFLKMIKPNKKSPYANLLVALTIICSASFGWFFLAFLWTTSWVLLVIKKKAALAETVEAVEETLEINKNK